MSERDDQISEQDQEFNLTIENDVLNEFTTWSLGDKADLTPKKFENMVPRVANILASDHLSVQQVLECREKFIDILNSERNKFELEAGIKIIMEEVHLNNKKEEDEFRQDLQEIVDSQKPYMDSPPMTLLESFQAIALAWKESRDARSFDDCRFFKMPASEFYDVFYDMLPNFVNSQEVSDSKEGELFQKFDGKLFQQFCAHPTARKKHSKVVLQQRLFSLLSLYQEMKRCWGCDRFFNEEIERSLICASCKCATYCSRECQVKHWKEGRHKDHCKEIRQEWSSFERNKKRIRRALYKDKRIYNKPIQVNGIEKECFLRPSETLDHLLCIREGDVTPNLDIFYKNVANLACGGKHLLFGNKTISSELEEKINIGLEHVVSDFDPNTLNSNEMDAMRLILPMLRREESDFLEDCLTTMSNDLSVDRFLTIYICFESYGLCTIITRLDRNWDKVMIERNTLEGFKKK